MTATDQELMQWLNDHYDRHPSGRHVGKIAAPWICHVDGVEWSGATDGRSMVMVRKRVDGLNRMLAFDEDGIELMAKDIIAATANGVCCNLRDIRRWAGPANSEPCQKCADLDMDDQQDCKDCHGTRVGIRYGICMGLFVDRFRLARALNIRCNESCRLGVHKDKHSSICIESPSLMVMQAMLVTGPPAAPVFKVPQEPDGQRSRHIEF